MDTMCGSFTLAGAKAFRNAGVIDVLIEARMIIIEKANLLVWPKLDKL